MNNIMVRLLTAFIPCSEIRKDFRKSHDFLYSLSKHYFERKILSDSANPKYFNLMQKINKFFNVANIGTMNNFIVDRVLDLEIKNTINVLKNNYPDKEILLLTDKENEYDCKKIKYEEIENYKNSDKYIFLLGYNQDYSGVKAAKLLSESGIKYESVRQGTPVCKYYHTDKDAWLALKDEWERKDRKDHFAPMDFENIFQAIKQTRNLEGDYVEIGTFQGASARAALNYMKRIGINRRAYFFDTYEGFVYKEAKDSEDIRWCNTHTETSLSAVKEFLSEYNNAVCIKSNIIQDELPAEISKIAAANIDVDMYEAVKAALYKVKDKIVQYGIIIAEDFGHTPGLIGAQKAVMEFLEENPNQFISILSSAGQMMMIKK